MTPITETHLPMPLLSRGKVRDMYDLGDRLLIVATDRISAFDYVLPTPITDKGKVLTQISRFWFEKLAGIVDNHFIADQLDDLPPALAPYEDILAGRFMIVKKAKKFPIECVVRGYLSGSGWRDYRRTGAVCGITLPSGLRESDRLPELIFTPATKEEGGKHDENISFEQMQYVVGARHAEQLRELSIRLYTTAAAMAEKHRIIIADTKFEFGIYNDAVILIDEILTPDSSRFWDRDVYAPGGSQPSFDKQFVRDYLESIVWNKRPPVPELPRDIVEKTREKYLHIYTLLTNSELVI